MKSLFSFKCRLPQAHGAENLASTAVASENLTKLKVETSLKLTDTAGAAEPWHLPFTQGESQ